jgi:undecaprenyl-diphosphatase
MKNKVKIIFGACMLGAFALWTVLVQIVEVRAIGPRDSSVGFATLNSLAHRLMGVNMTLYTLTDWLGLVPIATALCFALLGLCQMIKRRSIFKVDRSILALGVFYIAVMLVYALFEFVIINYRPVLIDGRLEASYPSSTTLLVTCVMPTAAIQLNKRIKRRILRQGVVIFIAVFTAFMVIGRILSGVHWISDIIGGVLISLALLFGYSAILGCDG